MRKLCLIIALLVAGPALAPPAHAAAEPADRADLLAHAQAWLDALPPSRIAIDCTRDGQQAPGTILLDRAHRRARIEIDAPFRDTLVVNGSVIHVATGDGTVIRQATRASPLRYVVTPARIADSADVLDVARSADRVALTLGERDHPRAGRIVLEFRRTPDWNLVGWTMIDAKGLRTEVRIDYIQTDVKFADGTFRIPDDFRF